MGLLQPTSGGSEDDVTAGQGVLPSKTREVRVNVSLRKQNRHRLFGRRVHAKRDSSNSSSFPAHLDVFFLFDLEKLRHGLLLVAGTLRIQHEADRAVT